MINPLHLFGIMIRIVNHPMNRGRRIQAVLGFLRWQVGSFLIKWPIVYPFVGSSVLVVEKGMDGATGNIYNGLHEYREMLFLLHFLRETDIFVDVGANIGSYSVLASANCKAQSIAFEPVPLTFEYLRRNIIANNIADKVQLVNSAVGSINGKTYFTDNLDAANHSLNETELRNGVRRIEVAVTRLDDTVRMNPILIKIDVEGFESEVIKGGMATLSSPGLKAVIIELNGSGGRYGTKDEDIHQTLIGFGFSPHEYDPFTRKLTTIAKWGVHNTIYIRDIDYVRSRITSAKKIEVNGYSV